MAANVEPIFPLTPKITYSNVATANTSRALTSGTSYLVFTAATYGSRVDEVRVMPIANSAATVLRVFINNGLSTGTASNSILFAEASIPAGTDSQTIGQYPVIIPMDVALPNSYRVYVTIGTASNLDVSCKGGDY